MVVAVKSHELPVAEKVPALLFAPDVIPLNAAPPGEQELPSLFRQVHLLVNESPYHTI